MSIKENLQKLLKDGTEFYLRTGKVLAVDKTQSTCAVQLLDSEEHDILPEVQLQATTDAQGSILYYPKIGSGVVLSFFSKAQAIITAYSEVETIRIHTETLTINEGTYGGLVKVTHLVQKLNALEQDINTLKTRVKNWIPAPNDGGGALKTTLADWCAQTLTTTQKKDLENKKIKH